MMAPPVKSGPRYNQMINVPKVRVIDENGENLGVMYTREAIEQAAEVRAGRGEHTGGHGPGCLQHKQSCRRVGLDDAQAVAH